MGMIGCFAAVDANTQQRLVDDPLLIEGFLYPDGGESEPANYIDVDKAWHGIHFLLTGKADGGVGPAGLAILGGEPIGDDVGFGPARLLLPNEVRSVSSALTALDIETLRSRYIPGDMAKADIYPTEIWEREGDEAFDYLVKNYRSLVKFYADAASRGDGILLWLS